jgi:flavin reductase (DIM6/NTAB) family NADH-FMN oxidoreductase RutF
MHIDTATATPHDSYKLLINLVMPRPIAWVTSQNEQGAINLAPFSFFNAICGHPPYVIVSVSSTDVGSPKDTANNIVLSGEFVVNLVTEELLAAMNITAADFPPGLSELAAAGLTPAASMRVKVPRVAESRASLECKLHSTLALAGNTLIIGEVVMFHVADHLIGQSFDVKGFAPVGRLGSPSAYCRTVDRIDLPRVTFAQWESSKG